MNSRGLIGPFLGFAAAFAVLAVQDLLTAKARVESGPILSETDGAISEIVMHYVAGQKEETGEIYRSFISALPKEVKINIVSPDISAFNELADYLGPLGAKLQPIPVGHQITGWARDRWIGFEPAEDKAQTVLLSPKGELLAEGWPARAGDQLVGEDLSRSVSAVAAQRSQLYFDGGDFNADNDTVFVTPNVLLRNLQLTVRDKPALERALQGQLKRRVVMLDRAPKHHAGMFMMTAGRGTVFVADPSLAKSILEKERLDLSILETMLPGGADFSAETQELYDDTAKQVSEAGYRVVRIPGIHGGNDRSYITYVNVIIDNPDSSRVVYLPIYKGLDALNSAASAAWRSLGYEVRPIDVSSVYREGGTLHCLVNVLRRS